MRDDGKAIVGMGVDWRDFDSDGETASQMGAPVERQRRRRER